MQKSVILKKTTKARLEFLIQELFGEEFLIFTHDKEWYSFKERKAEDGIYETYSWHWAELCLSMIPEKLGITYLMVPINDENYNLAEYLIEYYEDICNSVKEKSQKEEKSKINKSLRDLPSNLIEKQKLRNKDKLNASIGKIISMHHQ